MADPAKAPAEGCWYREEENQDDKGPWCPREDSALRRKQWPKVSDAAKKLLKKEIDNPSWIKQHHITESCFGGEVGKEHQVGVSWRRDEHGECR